MKPLQFRIRLLFKKMPHPFPYFRGSKDGRLTEHGSAQEPATPKVLSGFHNGYDGSMGLTSFPSPTFTWQSKHLSHADRMQGIIIPILNYKNKTQEKGNGTAKETDRRQVGLPTFNVIVPPSTVSHCVHPNPTTTLIHQLSLKLRFMTQLVFR